jgi:hypothetical protein
VACLAGTLIAGGLSLFATSPASAAPPSGPAARGEAAPGVQQVQYGRCAELRRACLYKRELGETGDGNCARYRSACSGSSGYTSSYSRYREYRAYRPYYRAYRSWRLYD